MSKRQHSPNLEEEKENKSIITNSGEDPDYIKTSQPYTNMPKRYGGRKYGRRSGGRSRLQGFYKKSIPTARGVASEQFNLYGANYRSATPDQRMARARDSFYGRGGFWGDAWSGIKSGVGWGLKNFGGRGLAMAGGMLGGAPGAAAGAAAGTALGWGRYNMGGVGAYGDEGGIDNALVHAAQGPGNIEVANVNTIDDSGDIIVAHKEFIQNVYATGTANTQSTFQLQAFPINPGLQSSFPFLSQIAQCFSLYSLEGCIYTYKPTSGEAGSSSNQLGKVIMSTDYDPQALPFINAVQMENYSYSASCKPSLAMRHGVECAKGQTAAGEMQYVRTGTVTRDKTFTDVGLFQIATEGIPIGSAGGNVIIGELWVSYRVRLSRANLYGTLLGYQIKSDVYDIKQLTVSVTNQGLLPDSYFAPNPNTPKLPALESIGTHLNYYSNASGLSDEICIQWPTETILGVYKVTISTWFPYTTTNTNQVPCWAPALPTATNNFGNGNIYATQWGCPFLPTSSGHLAATAPNTPAVNTSTGQQIWTVGTTPDTRAIITYSSAASISIATSNLSTSIMYFAINSPSITVAQLTLRFGQINCNNGTFTGTPLTGFFSAQPLSGNQNSIRIAIEQVNSEISN